MMFMRNFPGALDLPKPNCQARRVVLSQLFCRPASQQGRGEGNPIPSRDIQFRNVECSLALRQRVEEWGSSLPISCDPAYSHGRRDIEHQHIIRVIGDDTTDVPGTYRRCPGLDEMTDGSFYILRVDGHGISLLQSSVGIANYTVYSR